MAIDYSTLINWQIPDVEQQITKRDSILYALGIGLGNDPLDVRQLRFVYEKELLAAPTMAVILCHPGPWIRKPGTGVTGVRLVHGEQSILLHRPLPAEGTFIGKSRVVEIIDKGKDRGALVTSERKVFGKTSGELLCELRITMFLRDHGGFGGPDGPSRVPHAIPQTEPELTCDLTTLPQAALIYRLSGDYNPLHVDPAVANAAGFDRPVLHGLCTMGVAGHAILKTCCDYEPDRLRSMDVRFSAPVFPGDSIRTEVWRQGPVVSFRCTVPSRNTTVINNGRAEILI
jgi:acyl dehydratase